MRYFGLDLIRCVAIVLLLLAHIGQTINSPLGSFFGIPHFYYVSLGGLAVTIYLILSGASLELNYGGRNIKYFQFILKRCIRIYPVYYLSLLFGIVIYFIRFYYASGDFSTGFLKLGIRDIVLSITGGYALAGEWGGPFVATSWFIVLIMTMYFLFPFLSREIGKHKIVSIVVLFLISFLSRFILGKYEILPNRPLDWFPLCRIFEFSLGILLAIVLQGRSLNNRESPRHVFSFVQFISKISFPLFLVHYPLLFIIPFLTSRGAYQLLAICLFVIISLTASWIILAIDDRLQEHFQKQFNFKK
jgi:peptidoglycan/LPS O-acetylase OafA/YrhL